MKLRKKAFASFVCSIALAGNSLGAFAQDKVQVQAQGQSGKVVVKTADGQNKEFTINDTDPVVVPVAPPLSVTVNVTVYVPAAA